MGFRVPGSEIPTTKKITGFLAHLQTKYMDEVMEFFVFTPQTRYMDHIPRLCLHIEYTKKPVIFCLVGISVPGTQNPI